MFLKPTAKPTPRFTPSPRVVFPAPPGSRRGSRGSSSAAGGSSAAAARVTPAAGGGAAATHSGGGRGAGDLLARRQGVAGGERVQQPQLARVDADRGREPVHL